MIKINLHYVTLITFLLFSLNKQAQEYTMCATPDIEDPNPFVPPSDPNFIANSDPIVYNMNFQIIYPETFLSEYTVTEDDCLEVIANMNREFNKFNLFFKYRGVNIINSDEFYFVERETNDNPNDGCSLNELNSDYDLYDYVDEPENFIENSLNTFVFYDSCGFSGLYLGDGKIGVRWGRFKEWHTIHEMGHMFGLGHTHSGFEYNPEDVSPDNVTDCERVTRMETDPNFNAYGKGDGYKDTAAMPKFGSNTNGQNNSVNENNCVYTGQGKDCGGDDYNIPSDSSGTLNFMNNGSECPINALSNNEGFTPEQGVRMYTTASTTILTSINEAITTVASLYEPYTGTYPQFTAPPTYNNQVLMQPGFDYKFVKCGTGYNQPSSYNDTSFIFDYSYQLKTIDKYADSHGFMFHPNKTAISIAQLPEISGDASSIYIQPRKCYDYYSPPSGGKVTKFNDGVINYNTTTTDKNAAQIVDPSLIPSLDPGLYKIVKEREDGTAEETVIQKGGN